jgi:hypothetical protein
MRLSLQFLRMAMLGIVDHEADKRVEKLFKFFVSFSTVYRASNSIDRSVFSKSEKDYLEGIKVILFN